MSISVPNDKILRARTLANALLMMQPTLTAISVFLGFLVSLHNAFLYAPIYYRGLQLCLLSNFRTGLSWDDIFTMGSDFMTNLSWRSKCPPALTPIPIKPLIPSVTIYWRIFVWLGRYLILWPLCSGYLVNSWVGSAYQFISINCYLLFHIFPVTALKE